MTNAAHCFSARPTQPPHAMTDAATTPTTDEQLSGPALAEQAVSVSALDFSTAAADGSSHKRAHETMATEEGKDGGEDGAPAAPLRKKLKRQPVEPESTSASSPFSSSAAAVAAAASSAFLSAALSDDSAAASQLGSSAQMHPRNLYRLRPPVSSSNCTRAIPTHEKPTNAPPSLQLWHHPLTVSLCCLPLPLGL